MVGNADNEKDEKRKRKEKEEGQLDKRTSPSIFDMVNRAYEGSQRRKEEAADTEGRPLGNEVYGLREKDGRSMSRRLLTKTQVTRYADDQKIGDCQSEDPGEHRVHAEEHHGGLGVHQVPVRHQGRALIEEEVNIDDVPAARTRPAVVKPSQRVVDEHNLTYIPYQDWCRTSVANRAVDDPHRSQPDVEAGSGMSQVHFDYGFFRSRPHTPVVPFLVGVCRDTGMRLALVVRDRHGRHPETLQAVEQCLREMGHHGPLCLRSDGESALQDLLNGIALRRTSRTIVEKSPRGDSQANGRAERSIRSVEELTRVLKSDLEKRMDCALDPNGTVFEWLIRHVVDILNKRQPGKDGRTPWERLRGRPYTGEWFIFGCSFLHRMSGKPIGGVLVERWNSGHWLGCSNIREHQVVFDSSLTPRQLEERALDDEERANSRRWRIGPKIFKQYVFTDGCRGCEVVWDEKIHQAHVPECREHLETILMEDLRVLRSCLLYTSPSPRDATLSRMPSSA